MLLPNAAQPSLIQASHALLPPREEKGWTGAEAAFAIKYSFFSSSFLSLILSGLGTNVVKKISEALLQVGLAM